MKKIIFRYTNTLNENLIFVSLFALSGIMIVPIIMIFYPSLPDWVFIFVPLALLTLTLILKKWGGKIIIDEKAITKRFLFWNEWSLPLDEIVELCPGRIELGRRFS
ncbi:MAG TPA: hypothetical protein VE973_01360, partial [Candidatus Limnocylindria bacterium]|nr:hypothetical protein [Candidatus Limnocylindria bacterium]